MCGRYSLRRIDYTREEFVGLRVPAFEEFDERPHPRFNIAPSQKVQAIRVNSKGQQVVSMLTWGLMPSWVKADTKAKPFNARAETVKTNGMYRGAFERRRCLIPADGFFEWLGAKGPKQPFFIRRPHDQVFAFGELWERWKSEDGEGVHDSCCIIATEPNDVVRPIHNRMPVILHREDYAKWLDREKPGRDVAELLCPYDGELEAYTVSALVNKASNQGPKLIERTTSGTVA